MTDVQPGDPVAPRFKIDPRASFDALYGLELLDADEVSAHGRVAVRSAVMQPWGVVHGGVYAAVGESLASWATARSVAAEGALAMGQSNNTSFLRPISAGAINSTARRLHRGRTTWVWDVDHRDDEGRLCATSRVTVAVRPGSGS